MSTENTIKIHQHLTCEGRFRFRKHKVDAAGNEIPGTEHDTGWMRNLITNGGLDRLGSGGPGFTMGYVQVGSGNAAPAVTDGALQALVAAVGTTTYELGNNPSPRYGWRRTSYRFAVGAAAGNLSEVGVGWGASGSLFSRALIVDSGGNPTTLVVLSDEVLDVTYEIRVYISVADSSYNLDIVSGSGTTTYACVQRAAYIDNTNLALQYGDEVTVNNNNRASGVIWFEGAIGVITGPPTGANSGGTYANKAYVAGSYTRGHTMIAGLNAGNFAGGIGAVLVSNTFCDMQIGFTPKIPKLATMELKLECATTWGRHVP